MAGTIKMFSNRKNILSRSKKNLLFLPRNMAAMQNHYYYMCNTQAGSRFRHKNLLKQGQFVDCNI